MNEASKHTDDLGGGGISIQFDVRFCRAAEVMRRHQDSSHVDGKEACHKARVIGFSESGNNRRHLSQKAHA